MKQKLKKNKPICSRNNNEHVGAGLVPAHNKGITLIALILTIIVLLILAVVAISAVTGNGIIAHAKNSRELYGTRSEEENSLLQNYLEQLNKETNGVSSSSDGKETDSSDISTLTIGTAINADKYGWKVPGYTVTTTEFSTGVWRLFYQDSEYTYLITDELVGAYDPSNYYSNYTNGSNVSQVGQKLSPTISTLFSDSNTNSSIRATAWFTDTEKWKDYINDDAVFAIASPTLDLFAASYNATGQERTITLEKNTYGYDTSSYIELNTDANHGIYNKDTSSIWWLASPSQSYGGDECDSSCWVVQGIVSCLSSCTIENNGNNFSVRPVVCIPTSIFNNNYSSGLVND